MGSVGNDEGEGGGWWAVLAMKRVKEVGGGQCWQ